MLVDNAVNELYEFTFNMSYSKEHNPDSDEKLGGGIWGGNVTPNYVFVLNIIEDTMSSIQQQYNETNFYDKLMFAKKKYQDFIRNLYVIVFLCRSRS